MRSPAATAVAIAIGIVVLIGFFFPVGVFQAIHSTLLDWALILAAVAGLVGLINLMGVHLRKAKASKERDVYSPFLLLAFALTFLVGVVDRLFHPAFIQFDRIVTDIQVPIEASLMAILAVSLVYASVRLFKYRRGVMPVVFAVSVVVFLLLASGIFSMGQNIPVVNQIVLFFNRLPLAGARGILLGVALGSLTAGLRILIGADRPYSG